MLCDLYTRTQNFCLETKMSVNPNDNTDNSTITLYTNYFHQQGSIQDFLFIENVPPLSTNKDFYIGRGSYKTKSVYDLYC